MVAAVFKDISDNVLLCLTQFFLRLCIFQLKTLANIFPMPLCSCCLLPVQWCTPATPSLQKNFFHGSLPLFSLLFLSDRFHFTFSSSSLPSHLRFLVLALSLAGKTMLTQSRWQFFPHILPCRWWSSSPSLPTLIWGAVTVKRELEVDKNYSLDLNRCNIFRWWEEGLNFAAAGIFWHLCFLSKPYFAFEEATSSQWRQR